MKRIATTAALAVLFAGCSGQKGDAGPAGTPGVDKGTISGTVADASHSPVAGVSIATQPASSTATSDAQGAFRLSSVTIGTYAIVATKPGFTSFTLTGVGVAAGGTTNVSLALAVDAGAPGTIAGFVTDSKIPPGPVAGATVTAQGQSATATTDSSGAFTLTGVVPGPVFLTAIPPDLGKLLPTETRSALTISPGATLSAVTLVVSARPSDTATYVGMSGGSGCASCHGPTNDVTGDKVTPTMSAAHTRSLTRIARDGNGWAAPGAWARLLNPTLTNPRTVMITLPGTIQVPNGAVVNGTGTAFETGGPGVALQAGDSIGYTPVGLGWTQLGVVQSVDSDTQVTLASRATFAPGVTSLPAGTKYGVQRLSSTGHTHMWPNDATDIVAPAWPGVKATSPNYDPNDPCIYGNAPPASTCAAGGTTKYADGQVNVYLCNLRGSTVQGVTYANDEYVMKFGGVPYACSDGTFWDGVTTPAVPLVRIDVVYGGQGDKDGAMAAHQNLGVFKQRYQGRLADIKAVSAWIPAYTSAADSGRDSLTLPIQILESGDRVNGGFKMNGYHPTEQKFPGESWTQRTRTFSHACAGCHATGMSIGFTMQTIDLAIPRDGDVLQMTNAAITSFNFIDENITCEHCHGPGSEHVASPGRGNGIINPRLLTAEAERQVCGKCHTYDDATNAMPAQTYGFEYPWNTDFAAKIGGGSYVPGVYEIRDFFDDFGGMSGDGEAFWDPARTGGKLYGQAHRQQNAMLSFSKHTNNAYEKITCSGCHDSHSTYRSTATVKSTQGDTYVFPGVAYRDNALCLTCHAGAGAFATISQDDVAALHISAGGAATRNGAAIANDPAATITAQAAIASAVSQHMADTARMSDALYQPLSESLPVGRCTSCHMPKVAKSGGYTTGPDAQGNEALVEGDEASHVFDVIQPWQSQALSMGGPTFQSGYYGQAYSASNVKYDKFGYMPNSCGKCHAGARPASMFCPDSSNVWPTFWPLNDPTADPNMAWVTQSCFTSTTMP